jgi:PKD repeat protein
MRLRTSLSITGIIIPFLLFSHKIAAQKKFTANPVDSRSSQSLRSHFNNYSLFRINTSEIRTYAKAQQMRKANFELELPGLTNWKLAITEHDILSPSYSLTINSTQGKTVLSKPACMTYAGYLVNIPGSRVSLTIDNDIIYGIIRDGVHEYFIEPVSYLNKGAATGLFVVYDTRDVVTDPNLNCGFKETSERTNSIQRLMAGTNCVQTQLAIASDQSMFLRYGSAAAVQTHNIGVMNNVIWDYVNAQFNDNIEFVIVTQNVSTSPATDQLSPAHPGTNAYTILQNFANWGQAANFGTTYDLAQFWTTRDLDDNDIGGNAGIVGLAYQPGLCGPARYHILEDFAGAIPSGSGSQLRVLTSHEIGHNFSCAHDAGTGFIMSPTLNITSTWSAASVASVDGYVPGVGCLSACNLAGAPIVDFIATPEAVCVGGSIQLKDHSLHGPTSWAWTMTGATPSTSTIRNPTISYATSGIKTISLISSNGGGSGTGTSKSVLISNAGTAACTNPGVSSTETGVKSFSLNTINQISGSTAADGNKYMDFSCTGITRLEANTSYTVSVDVGTFTPSNQFNAVQLFIDYNNDGDFVDANEAVYSSPTCYIGVHSFTFTTPATPPVANQFLRTRVIAKDCVAGINACFNVTDGQVEDYSVYFASAVSLPVSLLSFEGYHYNDNNILKWQTTNEIDNSHFEIERSTDGISFEKIGSVDGGVNSNIVRKYSFVDPLNSLISREKLYYRLKIVSLSGQPEYSKTIAITINTTSNDLLLSLQPNPFNRAIGATVQLKSATTINMQLIDMTGRLIYNEGRRLPAGIHSLVYEKLDVLAKGSYILKLSTDTQTISRVVEKH